MKFNKIIPPLTLFIALTACSANISGAKIGKSAIDSSGGPIIPSSANTIALHKIENLSADPAIPVYLMPRIKEALIKEGRLSPVELDENPDLTLNIIITDFSKIIIKFDGQRSPVQTRIAVTLYLTMKQTKTERTIFSRVKVSAYKDFSEITMPVLSGDAALQALLIELAERVAAAVSSGWYTDLMKPLEKGKK